MGELWHTWRSVALSIHCTHCSHPLKRSGRGAERSVLLRKADPWLVCLGMDLELFKQGKGDRLSLEALVW